MHWSMFLEWWMVIAAQVVIWFVFYYVVRWK